MSRTGASFGPLRVREFRYVWAGSFTSNVGTWMQTAALGDFVARQTDSAIWPAVIAACEFVPTALLAPVGGAFADRYDRRRLMLVGTALQATFAAILTVLMAVSDPPPIVVALYALANGMVFALAFPAFQALLPDLVPPEMLTAAIGLSSAVWNLGRVVGPTVGVLVYGAFGVAWVIAVNAISFVAVVAALMRISIPERRRGAPMPILAAVREGVGFVRADAGLRVSIQAMSVNTLLAAPFIGLIPAMVVTELGAPESATGWLITAQGLGAVVTGFALGAITERIGVRSLMVRSLTLMPIALVVYALSPNVAFAVVALFFVGMLYFAALSSFTTVAQRRAPEALRGRVLSVNNLILGVFYPLGILVQGAIGDAVGLRTVTIAAATLMLLIVVAQRVVRPRSFDPVGLPASQLVAD